MKMRKKHLRFIAHCNILFGTMIMEYKTKCFIVPDSNDTVGLHCAVILTKHVE